MLKRDAFVAKFIQMLPGWLRRCGVRRADLADAVQEAIVEALVKLPECRDEGLAGTNDADLAWLEDAGSRHELMRIVSNVALRARRRVQRENDRYLNIDHVEMASVRDEEAWVEARVIVLMALENLDEPTRALIYAHEIEGRTNIEIAASLKVKEDAVEKRVFFAKQRLRSEVEHIEKGWRRTQPSQSAGLFVAGLALDFSDPFVRAMYGSFYEAMGRQPVLSISSTPFSKFSSFVRPNLPTTALVGVLVLAPVAPETLDEASVAQVPTVKRISSAVSLRSVLLAPPDKPALDKSVLDKPEPGEVVHDEPPTRQTYLHASRKVNDGGSSVALVPGKSNTQNFVNGPGDAAQVEVNKTKPVKLRVDPVWYRVESVIERP